MWGMLRSVAVLTVVVTACSSGGTPATTPTSIATTTTTTTVPPSPSTTTTEATTTTVDRLVEIEAIFQDLEERRLQALYDGDREAFQALFTNDEYMERSMGAFDVVEFEEGWEMPKVVVLEILGDESGCIAVATSTDFSDVFVGSQVGEWVEVIEETSAGWGLSYAGEGWTCNGPHPLSP